MTEKELPESSATWIQANLAAKALAHVRAGTIYTSTLRRALETTEIFAKTFPKVPVRHMHLLREAIPTPIPRMPDGHVDLTGPWVGGGSNGDIEADGGLKPGELPLQQWAKDVRAKRLAKDEPYTACLPMSVPRVNPYPWKFAYEYEEKGLTHIYVLHETGDAGAHRVVYMDGRPHAKNWVNNWWGHSIGRWE